MNSEYKEMVADSNYLELDPQFKTYVNKDGWQYITNFIPQNQAIFTKGKLLPTMLKYDANNKLAIDCKYLGAFCVRG